LSIGRTKIPLPVLLVPCGSGFQGHRFVFGFAPVLALVLPCFLRFSASCSVEVNTSITRIMQTPNINELLD